MKELLRLSEIKGQEKVARILKSFIIKKKIYKTFLFSGIDGTGKKNSAQAFAAACNCNTISSNNKKKQAKHADACGSCNSCKLIASKNHPDILYVKPQKTVITVSDIRSILDNSSMKPYIAKHKVIIVPKAQNMNSEASNAFLKFLEEPHFKTIVILIAPSQTNLIPTIVSRCQNVRFPPISLKNIKEFMLKNELQSNFLDVKANLSNGSFSKAKQLIDKHWWKKRNWLILTFNSLCCNKTKKNIDIQGWLLFAEALFNQQGIVNNYLTMIKLWLRDILVYKLAPSKIINTDMLEKISATSSLMDYDSILDQINIVQKAQSKLSSNGNLRLVLDAMTISMARICYKKHRKHSRHKINNTNFNQQLF